MWYLTEIKTNKRFHLLGDKPKYAVSRNAELGDLVLATDASISRSHAALHPDGDHVKLVDTGSKYGTFVNGNIDTNVPMEKNVPVQLRQNDRIRFGRLESLYRLDRLAIASLSTTLTTDEKKSLKRHLDTVNGRLLTDWSDQCTHLTVARLSITMKVLHGLAGTVPIVTPAYWTAFVAAARRNDAAGPPDPQAFRPPIAEAYITPSVSLRPNVERRRLFAGKQFVFMLHAHMERYELCVQLAGGRCCSLDRKKVQRSTLLKADVCVVQYHPSTQSQASEDIGQVSRFLRDNERRTIPESEIGLALLHCSTRKYCNASFRVDGEFVEQRLEGLVQRTPSAVLAAETENAGGGIGCSMAVEVPETALGIVYDSALPVVDRAEVAAMRDNDADGDDDVQFVDGPPVHGHQSNVYDTVAAPLPTAVTQKRRAARDGQHDDISLAKRAKPSELLDDDSDDDLLNSISEAVEESTVKPPQPTPQNALVDDDEDDHMLSMISQAVEDSVRPRSPFAPPAASTQSQSVYNASGFLPRTRPTQRATQKPADGDADAAVFVRPSASTIAASRKRAHNLLLNDSDDDSDNGDDDDKGTNLFQFNAAATMPKRSRRSNNTLGADDSQQVCSNVGAVDSQRTQQTERVPGSLTTTSNSLYPNRRNASRLLNMSVQPMHISLLSGWMSRSSIKCEVKAEASDAVAVKSEAIESKPPVNADGVVGEGDGQRIDSKAWLDQLRCGFAVRVCRMQLVNRTAQKDVSNNENNMSGRNFKAFAKKVNYRAQTSILKTVPAVPSTLNVFDF